MDRVLSCILLALSVSCLAGPSRAQRLHVRTYTFADGLPTSKVRESVQGADGLMWFATRAGLVSYDGAEWVQHGVQDGLIDEDVSLVRADGQGGVWACVSKRSVKVLRRQNGAWSAFAPLVLPQHSAEIADMAVYPEGDAAFVCAPGLGVRRVDPSGWSELTYQGETAQGETAQGETGERQVLALAIIGRTLYIACDDGLWEQALGTPGSVARPVDAVPREPIRGLRADGASLWIASHDWIGRFESGRFVQRALDRPISTYTDFARLSIAPDASGGLFVANVREVLWVQEDGSIRELGLSNGLVSTAASDAFRDREGNIWIACPRGISKIIGRDFETLTADHGLLADEVTAILERRSGEIVLGHEGGLTILEDPPQHVAFGAARSMQRVMDLAEAEDGTLWIAAAGLGVGELRPDQSLLWHRLPGRHIAAAVCPEPPSRTDPAGVLVGTSLGLLRLRGGRFEELEAPAPQFGVRRLELASDGSLFVSTGARGLLRRGADGAWTHWSPPGEQTTGAFGALERDESIWVGTDDGLYRTSGDKLVVETTPRIARPVFFILESPFGGHWFGTDRGVARWRQGELRWFGPSAGLAGNETNRDAGLFDSRGRLWIGTDRGVSVHDPSQATSRMMGPTIDLVSLDLGRRVEPLVGSPISIDSGVGSLLFRFRSISFVDEEGVLFRYRLRGLEEEWLGPVPLPTRQVRYTSLPVGDYRFELQAIDVNGRASSIAASTEIVVERPFWGRPWFLAAVVAAVMGLVWAGMHYTSQRRYAERLEGEVARRSEQLAASERALKSDRERLAITLASITEGVAATDERGRVFLWNRAAERLTGRDVRSVLGRSLGEAIGVDADPGRAESLQALFLDSKKPGLVQLEIDRPSGPPLLLEFSGAPLQGESSDAPGAVIAFRDVTLRRQFERDMENSQRLEALGLLAGGIAHDFNNYLTVIMGTLGVVAREGGLPRDLREKVRMAEDTLDRAVSLTQQLLTFSRGGAPVCRPVALAELVRDTLSFSLSGANVKSELHIRPGLSSAEVDPGQVSEVLHNLLLNARQAMPNGGTVRLTVQNLDRTPPELAPGRYVEIVVADDGVGIPPADVTRIFDPFFTRRDGGTGLGLAVSHSIVKRHGGRIEVESHLGHGTTFRVQLPATEEAPDVAEPLAESGLRTGGRVLVMDDEPAIRNVVSAMLRKIDQEPVAVADGWQALDAYREAMQSGTPFDAVILDLTVPGGLGGRDTMALLIELDPGVRAIAASGYSTDAVMAEHEQHGFSACLAKPFHLRDLARVLGDVMRPSYSGRASVPPGAPRSSRSSSALP